MQVTVQEMQKAFTEWDRMFREAPEEFQDLAVHLLKGNPETYGEECAPYFVALIKKVRETK